LKVRRPRTGAGAAGPDAAAVGLRPKRGWKLLPTPRGAPPAVAPPPPARRRTRLQFRNLASDIGASVAIASDGLAADAHASGWCAAIASASEIEIRTLPAGGWPAPRNRPQRAAGRPPGLAGAVGAPDRPAADRGQPALCRWTPASCRHDAGAVAGLQQWGLLKGQEAKWPRDRVPLDKSAFFLGPVRALICGRQGYALFRRLLVNSRFSSPQF
jgi:hypothetical protein